MLTNEVSVETSLCDDLSAERTAMAGGSGRHFLGRGVKSPGPRLICWRCYLQRAVNAIGLSSALRRRVHSQILVLLDRRRPCHPSRFRGSLHSQDSLAVRRPEKPKGAYHWNDEVVAGMASTEILDEQEQRMSRARRDVASCDEALDLDVKAEGIGS
jgi:hypothetical protein